MVELSGAMNQLVMEGRRRATEDILEKMDDVLTGKQLLELNHVLNDEFNRVEFIPIEKEICDFESENRRLLKAFIDAKTVEGLSERSLYKYNRDIGKLLDWLTDSLANTTTQDIRDFFTYYQGLKNCSNITLDGMRRSFSSFFRYLSNNGLIYKNPMNAIHKMRETKLYKKAFTIRELELLRKAIPEKDLRLKSMFELLLSSGIRRSELHSMKISEINWDELTFIITGKGNKQRRCYFNEKSKLALQDWIMSRKDRNRWNKKKYSETNDYLWVSTKKPYLPLGKHHIGRIIKELGEKAGVKDVHPHRFRRTCATVYLNRGMPIEQVQRLLGHESIMTTQLYINVNEQAVKLNHKRYLDD